MEKIKNRENYLKKFIEFSNEVEIDEVFEEKLKKYKFFQSHIDNIEVSYQLFKMSEFSKLNLNGINYLTNKQLL